MFPAKGFDSIASASATKDNKDENDDIYYLPPEDYDGDEDYQQALLEELEVLDYYREANVFWVPKPARWSTLKEKAVLPVGTVLWQDDAGNDVKLRSVSWLIDNALEEIEKSPKQNLNPLET